MSDSTQRSKCEALAALHGAAEAWVIPNPWDVGSARTLEKLGFQALATSSSAFAQAIGLQDGEVTLTDKLTHCEQLARATAIPISADFEDGFGTTADDVARNVARLIQTGIAGCSIEDYSRDQHTVFELAEAVDRVRAAVTAVRASGLPFQITRRAENLLRNDFGLDDTIQRLVAYSEVGADVLYAPGLRTVDDIRRVKDAVGKPINVLSPFLPRVSVAALSAAGATRISLGGALYSSATNKLIADGEEMLAKGTFGFLG